MKEIYTWVKKSMLHLTEQFPQTWLTGETCNRFPPSPHLSLPVVCWPHPPNTQPWLIRLATPNSPWIWIPGRGPTQHPEPEVLSLSDTPLQSTSSALGSVVVSAKDGADCREKDSRGPGSATQRLRNWKFLRRLGLGVGYQQEECMNAGVWQSEPPK